MDFSLALSGGGVRGATHIGVICALEENGLYPTSIAGTSAGSIVAGLYAIGYDGTKLINIAEDIYKRRRSFLDYDVLGLFRCACGLIVKRQPCIEGLLKGNALERYIYELTWGRKISDCEMDILIPAVDIISGDTVVYTNYDIYKKSVCGYIYGADETLASIIRASCAVPAVFRPKHMGNRVLVDGGVTNNLPVDLLNQNGGKNIIEVDISRSFEKHKNLNIINISTTSFNIMSSCLKDTTSQCQIMTLKPKLPEDATLLNFDAMIKCMDEGYEYTLKMMPTIKSMIENS